MKNSKDKSSLLRNKFYRTKDSITKLKRLLQE